MTQVQFAKMLADLDPAVLEGLLAKQPKAEKTTKAQMLANKDKTIRATFTKRGIKDVVLLDRTDPTKAFNVKPYKAWIAEGRIVMKGQKAVKGLFHVSQTQELPADKVA
jgi:hypothetical protein